MQSFPVDRLRRHNRHGTTQSRFKKANRYRDFLASHETNGFSQSRLVGVPPAPNNSIDIDKIYQD